MELKTLRQFLLGLLSLSGFQFQSFLGGKRPLVRSGQLGFPLFAPPFLVVKMSLPRLCIKDFVVRGFQMFIGHRDFVKIGYWVRVASKRQLSRPTGYQGPPKLLLPM